MMSSENLQNSNTFLDRQLEYCPVGDNFNNNVAANFVLDIKKKVEDDEFSEGKETLQNPEECSLNQLLTSDIVKLENDSFQECLRPENECNYNPDCVSNIKREENVSEALQNKEACLLKLDTRIAENNQDCLDSSLTIIKETESKEQDDRWWCTSDQRKKQDAGTLPNPVTSEVAVAPVIPTQSAEEKTKITKELGAGLVKLCSLARLHAVGQKEEEEDTLAAVRWLVKEIKVRGKPVPEWTELILEAMLEQADDTTIEGMRRAAGKVSRNGRIDKPLKLFSGVLMQEGKGGLRLYISIEIRVKMIKLVHGEDHLPADQVINKLEPWVFWPGWEQSIADFIRNCNRCNIAVTNIPALKPWDAIVVTVVQGLNVCNRGNNTLFVAADLFSGFFEVAPKRGVREGPLAYFIKVEIEARWGSPKCVLLDPQLEHLRGKLGELTGLPVQVYTENLMLSSSLQPFQVFEKLIKTAKREWPKVLPGLLWDARKGILPLAIKTPKQLLTNVERSENVK